MGPRVWCHHPLLWCEETMVLVIRFFLSAVARRASWEQHSAIHLANSIQRGPDQQACVVPSLGVMGPVVESRLFLTLYFFDPVAFRPFGLFVCSSV